MYHIEKIFIITCLVFAVNATMLEGMIFGIIRKLTEHWNENIKKPIYDCVICMSPYYGSMAYWIIWGSSWEDWLVSVIGAMGLCTIFVRLFPFEPNT